MGFVSDVAQKQTKPVPEIGAEQIRIVYRAVPLIQVAHLINATVLVLVMIGEVDSRILLSWYLVLIAVSAMRLWSQKRFLRSDPQAAEIGIWRFSLIAWAMVGGALWGITAWILWVPDSTLYQGFIVMMISGMSAGALSTSSALLPSAIYFILLACMPLIVRFSIEDTAIGVPMAAVVSLFLLSLMISSWRLNRMLRGNLEARFERAEAERRLAHEAMYDALTNLPNRRFLLERLQQEYSRAKRHGHVGVLLFLDLDNFKTINDSLGHHPGDQLLRQVADRLERRFRNEDMAARLGGDEFVVLLPEITEHLGSNMMEAEQIAEQLKILIAEPYDVEGHKLHVSASIGIAMFPGETENYQEVLQNADTAMYRAKDKGRDNFQFFLPDMLEAAKKRLEIEKELRVAITGSQLSLHYQPQIDLQGRLVGLEALARWQHPEKGNIPPDVFIPVADECALVLDLHDWVLGQVCRDIRRMMKEWPGESMPLVSINLSPRAFLRPGFEQHLYNELDRAGVPGRYLSLEITESSAMENVELVIEKMRAVRRLGVSFAIDDFGTGYSSLAYLKRLPVDALKVDRSFVRDILVDPNDAVIVETILSMANHLSLNTIAEGVETIEVAEFLKQRGCQVFQGWLYGRPQPLAVFLKTDGRLSVMPLDGSQ